MLKVSAKPNLFPLIFALTIVGMLFLSVEILLHKGYKLVYQKTPSMPRGFYLITPPKNLKVSDIVIFKPSPNIATFLAEQKWVPASGLIMKYVVGIPGDYVCSLNHGIWLNDKKLGPIFHYYAPGKLLPNTKFCGRLSEKEYFVMSTKIPRSFDSRYFGPINLDQIEGKAFPLRGTGSSLDNGQQP